MLETGEWRPGGGEDEWPDGLEGGPVVEIDLPDVQVRVDRVLARPLLTSLMRGAAQRILPGAPMRIRLYAQDDRVPGWVRVVVEDDGGALQPVTATTGVVGRVTEGASGVSGAPATSGAAKAPAAPDRIFAAAADLTPAMSATDPMATAVCRAIVARHGGTFTASSTRHGGTAVEFTVPIADATSR